MYAPQAARGAGAASSRRPVACGTARRAHPACHGAQGCHQPHGVAHGAAPVVALHQRLAEGHGPALEVKQGEGAQQDHNLLRRILQELGEVCQEGDARGGALGAQQHRQALGAPAGCDLHQRKHGCGAVGGGPPGQQPLRLLQQAAEQRSAGAPPDAAAGRIALVVAAGMASDLHARAGQAVGHGATSVASADANLCMHHNPRQPAASAPTLPSRKRSRVPPTTVSAAVTTMCRMPSAAASASVPQAAI